MNCAQIYLEQGNVLKNQGQWQAALPLYQKAIELEPTHGELHHQLGDTLLTLERYEEAVSAYSRSLELDPKFIWSHYNLGVAFYQLEQYQEALDCHQNVTELYPQFWESNSVDFQIQLKLGDFFFDQHRFQDATLLYQRAITLNPNSHWSYVNLGRALDLLGQTEAAIASIRQGVEVNPDFGGGYFYLAEILEQTGRKEEAVTAYNRAFTLQPELEDLQNKSEQLTVYQQHELTETLVLPTANQQPELTETLPQLTVHQQPELTETSALLSLQPTEAPNAQLKLEYGCWLSPSIVYLEASIQDRWVFGPKKVFVQSYCSDTVGQGHFFQISHHQLAGVVITPEESYTMPYNAYHLTVIDDEVLIAIEGEIFEKAYSLEFIQHLNHRPSHQKHLIRESLSWGMIERVPQHLKPEVGSLLYKLQSFLQVTPNSLLDPNLPFNIYIDQVIPISSQGLFLHGWIHDPYNHLEAIEAISALGFSLTLSPTDIYRLERQDVSEYIQSTRYANFDNQLGFCSYAQVPEEIRCKFEDFAQLHSFRFKIKLKGGIELDILPDTKYHDIFSARQLIVNIALPQQVSDEMLKHCIGPAAAALQQLCIAQVEAKEVKSIGQPILEPIVSIIIPLYKQLDFMKVQLATLAHDPYTQNCEIIYVLDSPEQEIEVKNFLTEHCALYQIPVKLVVMNRNSGYAMANNIGVKSAQGQYLVLMNSDVFAKAPGWLEKMVAFYQASPQIGVLAPKLLYEDESLQHAGMFFEKTTFPFWIPLHYYKGFPHCYPQAQISRPVPAVTGACLMIEKGLYEKVGGYSTDYIIGDFEDSDLCLKCAELGSESWYYAEAELYHLERQSVPQSPVYSSSIVWRYNAHFHQQRWETHLQKQMEKYHQQKQPTIKLSV